MRIRNATVWRGACVLMALVCAAGLSAQQQQAPPAPTGQQPAAGQQPAGAPGAPAQGRGRGGGFRQPDPIDFEEHDGWTSLFDGKTLNGWSGDSNWKVEDGAITIESTCEKPTGTVYLVWKGGEAADFELKIEMKGTGRHQRRCAVSRLDCAASAARRRGWTRRWCARNRWRSAAAPPREARRLRQPGAAPAAPPARRRRGHPRSRFPRRPRQSGPMPER